MSTKNQKHSKSAGRNPRRKNKGSSKPSGGRNLTQGSKQSAASLSLISEAWMPLFPARTVKTLRYHEDVVLTVSGGAVTNYLFRANDLFDPNVTGTGHQPMGFDQMMVFYNHFAVAKCKIVVNFECDAASTLHVGIRLDASSTPLTNIDQIIEFGGIKIDSIEAKNTYGSNKALELSVDIARIQGIPRRNITTDPNLRGDAATSPQELTYWHLFAWDPKATSGSVKASVTLEQVSYFMEPRDATVSLAGKKTVEEKTELVLVDCAGACSCPKKR